MAVDEGKDLDDSEGAQEKRSKKKVIFAASPGTDNDGQL